MGHRIRVLIPVEKDTSGAGACQPVSVFYITEELVFRKGAFVLAATLLAGCATQTVPVEQPAAEEPVVVTSEPPPAPPEEAKPEPPPALVSLLHDGWAWLVEAES